MRQSLGVLHDFWLGIMAEAGTWRGALMLGAVLGAAVCRVVFNVRG